MPLGSDDLRRLTFALRSPGTAVAAARALRGATGRAEVGALVEAIEEGPSAGAAVEAIAALESSDAPIVRPALVRALGDPRASVRIAAIASLRRRGAAPAKAGLAAVLRGDPSWTARRAALQALAGLPAPDDGPIFEACTDPHWRVRHALIQVLIGRGGTREDRLRIEDHLSGKGDDSRTRGVREYLRFRWSGGTVAPAVLPPAEDPRAWCPFWDPDPAVLARELERMGRDGRRRALDAMPWLLGHEEERVRRWAMEALRRSGEEHHLAEVLALLDEPRHEAAGSALQLLGDLDLDRAEALARHVLAMRSPSASQLAWAVDQVGVAFPIEEAPGSLVAVWERAPDSSTPVRRALAGLVSREKDPDRQGRIGRFLDDPEPEVQIEVLRGINAAGVVRIDPASLDRLLASEDPAVRAEAVVAAIRGDRDVGRIGELADDPVPEVRARLAECLVARPVSGEEAILGRLRDDPHPRVRAAALTPERANGLIDDPASETSWSVLAKAARMAKVPFRRLEPAPPWEPEPLPEPEEETLSLRRGPVGGMRRLGRDGPLVCPLGISGHYGLPVEGYARAFEAGANLMFWEPNYQTLTRFAARLSPGDRGSIHFIAGTFEADGDRIRRDAERVLRQLGIERLDVFLIFWVRSRARISDDVLDTLRRLREAGAIGMYGLSSHARDLAVAALEEGWDPVMVRHSAAHRKAEEAVFPRAEALGARVITFNNTCYGRLLRSGGEGPPVGAADCYRYSLAHPAVAACFSAPATLAELEENLTVLERPELSEERAAELRNRGDEVYREDAVFRALVRSV
jgi:hypothetical protein